MNDDNRRIAKNTIYLYSRMIVMMLGDFVHFTYYFGKTRC